MARGWESKSVESQIESAERSQTADRRVPLTAEQIQLLHERESLELARARASQDLAVATNPRYRALLEATICHLDARLAALNSI